VIAAGNVYWKLISVNPGRARRAVRRRPLNGVLEVEPL
jgi:hypothetical protein